MAKERKELNWVDERSGVGVYADIDNYTLSVVSSTRVDPKRYDWTIYAVENNYPRVVAKGRGCATRGDAQAAVVDAYYEELRSVQRPLEESQRDLVESLARELSFWRTETLYWRKQKGKHHHAERVLRQRVVALLDQYGDNGTVPSSELRSALLQKP